MLKQRKNFIISCILLFGMLTLPINASTTHQTAYIDIYKNAVNAVVTIIVVAENSSVKELLTTIDPGRRIYFNINSSFNLQINF